jgi:poly(hydroxyalkanoate) depolymerase family esterase
MCEGIRVALSVALLPLIAASVLLLARPAAAAALTRVTGFAANPTNLNMYVYVPNNVAPQPALLVLVHDCSGSASGIFDGNGRDYVTEADRYGYVIVLPEATRSGSCFDVSTPQALQRNGGSDSTGIMSMVSWARSHYNVDPARIVVSGFSSGAMMTNVLAAEYPDVFSAASAFSGVPASPSTPGSTPPASPTTSSPPGTSACRVTATVNAWSTGLTESITVSNTGSTAVNGWSLSFTVPAGQTITSGWTATYAPASGAVTAKNVSYNAAIPAGGSVSIGFQATHTGNTGTPAGFTLNGAACGAA